MGTPVPILSRPRSTPLLFLTKRPFPASRLVFPKNLCYHGRMPGMCQAERSPGMNDLRRPGVLPFLLAEGALYGTFLWQDLSPGGTGSTPVKYAAILLCTLFSLLWALFGGGDRLTALALVLTGAADTFLLELDAHYAAGVLLFCGVQLCYFLRLYPRDRRSLWEARLGLFLLSLGALRFLGLLTALNLLALFYFSNFLCNALLSLGCPGRRWRIFSAGLCLFLCCDLCVAAYQFPGSLPDAVFQAARVGMWLFYLPGQVLIALSGLPESLT